MSAALSTSPRVSIAIDRDATLAARRGKGSSLVASFLEPVSLYRVIDGEELRSAARAGIVTGGLFSVPDERAHGASWATSSEGLVQWAQHWQASGRLGQDLFVLEAEGNGRVFYHLDPKSLSNFSPQGSAKQTASIALGECRTGLGCSATVPFGEVAVYRVDADGSLARMTTADVSRYVARRAAKPIELRPMSRAGNVLSGHILGVSVLVSQDGQDKLWSVGTADRRVLVAGGKTVKAAAEAAREILSSGAPTGDTVYLNSRPSGFERAVKGATYEHRKWGDERVRVLRAGASYVEVESSGGTSDRGVFGLTAKELMRDWRPTR